MGSLSLFLLLPLSLLWLPAATSVPEAELSSALSALRSHTRYSLFANAVSTSDLYPALLRCHVITLFPPPDPSVFALDMSSASASAYVSALRRHVVPSLRLSLLSLLSPGPPFPSLLPRHLIHVTSTSPLSLDGVHVAAPGIFYGPSIAVHGLEGLLLPRHHPASAPVPSADVAAPEGAVDQRLRSGHVITRGNTFRLEEEEAGMLTCPRA